MEDRIGNFEIDKEFDALLIDVTAPGSAVDIFSKVSITCSLPMIIPLPALLMYFLLFLLWFFSVTPFSLPLAV